MLFSSAKLPGTQINAADSSQTTPAEQVLDRVMKCTSALQEQSSRFMLIYTPADVVCTLRYYNQKLLYCILWEFGTSLSIQQCWIFRG